MGSQTILIFAGEEVPRMALRVLLATHRTSELPRVLPTKTQFWYMYEGYAREKRKPIKEKEPKRKLKKKFKSVLSVRPYGLEGTDKKGRTII